MGAMQIAKYLHILSAADPPVTKPGGTRAFSFLTGCFILSLMRRVFCVDRLASNFVISRFLAVLFNGNIRHGLYFAMADFCMERKG